MTSPAQTLVWIEVETDSSTPAEFVQYDGRVIGVSQEVFATLPTSPNVGFLFGTRGTLLAPGPLGFPRWLIVGVLVPAVITGLDNIPAANGTPEGWKSAPARAVYQQTARSLIEDYKVPPAVCVGGLANLYKAAVGNHVAPAP